MPIYEYECGECGVFEVEQRITADPLKKCPACKRKVQKLISLSAFHLKGTGWYTTDYARKGNGDGDKKSETKEATTSKSDTSSATTSTQKSETTSKSDSKSETASKSESASSKSSSKKADTSASSSAS